jgi:hypothetical protein
MGCGTSNRNVKEAQKGITSYDMFYEAISKGAKLVVLDDKVVDINGFLAVHRDGNEALEKVVGK